MRHRLLSTAASLAVLLAGCLSMSATPEASAAWKLTSAPAAATAAATTVTAGQAPTVKGVNLGLLGYSYTVTWPASAMASGNPVTGYLVTRMSATAGGGGSVLATGTCAGTTLLGLGNTPAVPHASGSNQLCTDTSAVSLGAVKYQVTPVYGNWRGTPSPWSTAVY